MSAPGLLWCGIIGGGLIVDRREIQLCPIRRRHLPPRAEGGEPPLEQPCRLFLLGRDEAHRVFVEAGRRPRPRYRSRSRICSPLARANGRSARVSMEAVMRDIRSSSVSGGVTWHRRSRNKSSRGDHCVERDRREGLPHRAVDRRPMRPSRAVGCVLAFIDMDRTLG